MTLLTQLVGVSRRVGASASRNSKVGALAEFLRALPNEDVGIAVHYLSGETPQGRSGIGYALLQQAAAPPPSGIASVSLNELDRALQEIAGLQGSGSAALRAQRLGALFARLTGDERRFLSALLLGELRQGALAGVMTDAVATAAGLPADAVRQAAMYARDLGELAMAALAGGTTALTQFQFRLFSPVAPMLAQSAADPAAALQALPGQLAFEWKMDGARIQVHKRAEEVRIFTRTLNDVTPALPEIVEAVRSLPALEIALDGEAIVFDASGRPVPFQVTMRRFGRKLDVERVRRTLPIGAFYFDCLYLEGRALTALSTQQRFEALAQIVPASMRMPRLLTSAAVEAEAFYDGALAAGHEGLMAKALDAPYQAGNRDARWLKIKRAHTLDLIVLAAEWGHGRRTGKLSNLHLGALDPESGQYVMLGKTFKGLTDAMLEWQTRELLLRETHRDRWAVYVRPELVVEVAFSDLQSSSRYPGQLALRLARVKRYRNDKRAEEADSMEAVRRIFAAQSSGSASTGH